MFFCLVVGVFSGVGNTSAQTSSRAVQGKDYLVLKRARILDEMGFDRPVEAMSMLVPSGWSVEGGVRWKSVNECRGEIVTWPVRVTSPDGEIQFTMMPARSFEFSQDPTLQEFLINASR